MRITYFGHSTLQIETSGTTLLFDPFFTGNKHAEGAGLKADDQAPDVVLLTHAHGDHWGDAPSILQRTGALLVADFEIAQYAGRQHNHEKIHPMNIGGSWTFDWGRVTRTYARHSSSFPDGIYGGLAGGFLLEIEGKTIYNSGDTCAFAEMSWLGEDYEIDLAFLPIGDDFTMGPEEAVRCVEMLQPGLTVPVHYDTFPYIEVDVGRFTSGMEEAGHEARVLAPGETLDL
ncbi:MAG TPA: metal-dependent hydrolase [Rubricoccaceae bacterium]|nr:metal-dependent hydrolase [Rubricoccaceae bacterium]